MMDNYWMMKIINQIRQNRKKATYLVNKIKYHC